MTILNKRHFCIKTLGSAPSFVWKDPLNRGCLTRRDTWFYRLQKFETDMEGEGERGGEEEKG